MKTKTKADAKPGKTVNDSKSRELSKIAQYWASRPGKGEIVNMRAVLK
jgi:hypothetical protein